MRGGRGAIPLDKQGQAKDREDPKRAFRDPYCPLPKWETWCYFLGWCGCVLYCGVQVYKASRAFRSRLLDSDFQPGWPVLGRERDQADFEWEFWTGEENRRAWRWHVLHLFLSRLVEWKLPHRRSTYYLMYSLIAVCNILGGGSFLVLCLSLVVGYLASLTGSLALVWIINMLVLGSLNYSPTVQFLMSIEEDGPSHRSYYLLMYSMSMCNMRIISFSVEKIKASGKEGVSGAVYGFLDLLTYALYLPMLFTGPVINYDVFSEDVSLPPLKWTKERVAHFLKDALRLFFWALVIEISLHYLYFPAILRNTDVLEVLPLWALAGMGYYQGQFFQVKYIVMYGLACLLARTDSFRAPSGPKCISRIHLYSRMWQCFDVGLYQFIRKYIYFPLGGSRYGVLRQFFASFISFCFVYYWHGAEDYLLVWSLMNFFGISLEAVGTMITQTQAFHALQGDIGDENTRRLKGVVGVFMCGMSNIAIFTFFAGTQVGYIFFDRLLIKGFPVSVVTVFLGMYCMVQVSMETDRWEARKDWRVREAEKAKLA